MQTFRGMIAWSGMSYSCFRDKTPNTLGNCGSIDGQFS